MITFEVDVTPALDLIGAERVIERCARSEGLEMKMKASLSMYPGSVHWHFKKGKERGTLELTLWRKATRVWFSVQERRSGAWIEDTVSRLKSRLERELE